MPQTTQTPKKKPVVKTTVKKVPAKRTPTKKPERPQPDFNESVREFAETPAMRYLVSGAIGDFMPSPNNEMRFLIAFIASILMAITGIMMHQSEKAALAVNVVMLVATLATLMGNIICYIDMMHSLTEQTMSKFAAHRRFSPSSTLKTHITKYESAMFSGIAATLVLMLLIPVLVIFNVYPVPAIISGIAVFFGTSSVACLGMTVMNSIKYHNLKIAYRYLAMATGKEADKEKKK